MGMEAVIACLHVSDICLPTTSHHLQTVLRTITYPSQDLIP